MNATLSTTDIVAFAANRLAALRQRAQGRVEQAQRLAGSTDALHCAYAVGQLLDQCADLHALAHLAGHHGDTEAELAIEAHLASTQATLITQAQLCRLASIPRVSA